METLETQFILKASITEVKKLRKGVNLLCSIGLSRQQAMSILIDAWSSNLTKRNDRQLEHAYTK